MENSIKLSDRKFSATGLVGLSPPHINSEYPDYEYWDGFDEFSLIEASYLWFGLKPNKKEFYSKEMPKRIEEIAKKISKIPSIVDCESWDDFLFSRESLINLANEIGDKPPFLFKEERSFDKWLESNRGNQRDSLELTEGGYRTIAVMAHYIAKREPELFTKANGELNINKLALYIETEAEILRAENEMNTRGVGRSQINDFIKKGKNLLGKQI